MTLSAALTSCLNVSQETDPRIREDVASALLSKGYLLGKLGESEDELRAYNKVIELFGSDTESSICEVVAQVLLNKAIVTGESDSSNKYEAPNPEPQTDETTAEFDSVIARYGSEIKPDVRHRVAAALLNKGNLLVESDRVEEGIKVYDDLIERFGLDLELGIRQTVAQGLRNELAELSKLDDSSKALQVVESHIERAGTNDGPNNRESVALALMAKVYLLADASREQEALDTCDQLVRDFEKQEEDGIRRWVAKALQKKGEVLQDSNRAGNAIEVYDDLVKRFGDDDGPDIRIEVLLALRKKVNALQALDRNVEALTACDDFLKRTGGSVDAAVIEAFAFIVSAKSCLLWTLHGDEASMQFADEVMSWQGEEEPPELRPFFIYSLMIKGASMEDNEARLALLEGIGRRYADVSEPGEQLAMAACDKASTLVVLGRSMEAMEAYDEVIRRYGSSTDAYVVLWVASALVGKTMCLAKLNRWTETLFVCNQISKRLESFTDVALEPLQAQAWYSNGVALTWLERRDEARLAYDVLLSAYGTSDQPKTRCLLEAAQANLRDL